MMVNLVTGKIGAEGSFKMSLDFHWFWTKQKYLRYALSELLPCYLFSGIFRQDLM